MGWLSALLLLTVIGEVWNLSCLWTRKSTQSGLCRAELAENIVYAKVLAVYKKKAITHSEFIIPSIFPEPYSAEMELLCNPSSHSWQLGATGTRFNLTGLGIADCRSYSLNVIENNTYYFFVRRDENGNLVPHEVNEQDPIFSDTPENKQMFSSIVQFSNCVSGTNLPTYSPELEQQEDNQFHCTKLRRTLYEKEELVRMLSQNVWSLKKSNNYLHEKLMGTQHLFRQMKKQSERLAMLLKQQQNKERGKLNAN
ncbi:coiled-coil domain-containing protein 3-like isoform X1 [Amblyraja radiata]|uniref:coiled-coil domain-containing protein 3-like isoform X1 n=1 Tax=Amblyraja radiata TaxID=386614 RepID=UPI0014027D8E|nr:coiled-coil domain-containing protein 3-like isoform X1 [Amblyraja radiata]